MSSYWFAENYSIWLVISSKLERWSWTNVWRAGLKWSAVVWRCQFCRLQSAFPRMRHRNKFTCFIVNFHIDQIKLVDELNIFTHSESCAKQHFTSKLTACLRKGQISIKKRKHFRWWCAKAWKLSLAWFWNLLQPRYWKMKSYVWKPS